MKRLLVTMLLAITAVMAANAQWIRTAGPEGGHFTTLAASATDVLAATWQGDIYRWNVDEGWTELATLDRVTLYSAGNTFLGLSNDTLYRSTDRGASWHSTGRSGQPFALTIEGSTIHVAEASRIFRSTDGGATWDSLGAPGLYAIGAIWAHDSMLIVSSAGSTDMYRSTDNGATWADAHEGIPFGLAPFRFFGEKETVYASLDQRGVFRSSNGGATWSELNEGLPASGGTYPSFSDMVIDNGRIIASISDEIYQFDGTMWRWTGAEKDVRFQRSGTVLYKTSGTGLEKSADAGANWESLNQGLRAVNIAAFARSGETIIAGGADGIYTSLDGGGNWQRVGTTTVEEFVNAGPVVLARGWRIARDQQLVGPGIISSTDDGATWSNSGSGITEDLDYISTIAANSSTLFAGFSEVFGFHGTSHWQSGGIFRSTDNGATWSAASSGLPSDGFSLVPVIDIVANDRVVVATTLAGLYRSTDNGGTWRKVASAPTYDDGLGVMVAGSDAIYLASKNRVMISADDGLTWTPSATGLEEFSHIGSIQMLGDQPVIFANEPSAPNRVLGYDGTGWRRMNSEFPDGVIFNTFMIAGYHMIGGTARSSVWRLSIVGSSVAESPGAASAVTVEPNPFTDATTIGFTLRSRADVRLEVIDLMGRRVATLQSGALDAGAHMLTLDAANLPSGRYLYRLAIDGTATSGTLVKW